MVKTLYHEPRGALHFNVTFKAGGMRHRLMAREVYGLKPAEIDWVYLVEQRQGDSRRD
jgi:hypothetical protein